MKKLFILMAAMCITTDAFALYSDVDLGGGTTGLACYVNNCPARYAADGSCDTICEWCTGKATTPTGYVNADSLGFTTTSVTRYVTVVCDDINNTYACVCSEKDRFNQLQTLMCDTGYYGTPSYTYTQRFGYPSSYTDSFTGCTRCPSSGGVYGTTSGPGATLATECYIPGGTSFSDDKGSGTYTDNCYYSK